MKYSIYRSTNELNNIYIVDENGQRRTGKMKDDITIQYFGPTLSATFSSSDKKPRFITDFSLGYLSYKNKATVIDDFTLTGGTLGLLLDFGVDVPINKNLSIEFMFAYTAGTLNQYKYQDNMQTTTIKLDKDNLESLSRIDLSVGLRLSK